MTCAGVAQAYMTMDHPDYSILAARIAVSNLHKQTKKVLSTLWPPVLAAVAGGGSVVASLSEALRAGSFEERRVLVVALGRDGQYLARGVAPTGNSCLVGATLMRVCVRCVSLEESDVVKCMAMFRALSLSVLARRDFAASEGILRQATGRQVAGRC
jgi:hypothetical protein